MISECCSTALSLTSTHLNVEGSESTHHRQCASRDASSSSRAAEEGGCAVPCQSVPRWRHRRGDRSNHSSAGRAAEEGGCTVSCESVPRWHHPGRNDSGTALDDDAEIHIFHPVSSIVIDKAPSIVHPSSDSSLLSRSSAKSIVSLSAKSPSILPTSHLVERKRVSTNGSGTPSSTSPKKKKKKGDQIRSSISLLTLHDFYDGLDSYRKLRRVNSPSHHPYMVQIASWREEKSSSIQSTLCTNQSSSGSISVLSTSSLSCSPMSSPKQIDSSKFSMCVVERNDVAQIYRWFGLATTDHFTCDETMLDDLKGIPPLESEDGKPSRNYTIVPKTKELFHNSHVTVMNSVLSPDPSLGIQKILSKAKAMLGKIFNSSFPFFSVSASKARNLPSISLGWTTTDCNAYKYHRTNIVGQIKPFLIKVGCDRLSRQTKRRIGKLSCCVISHLSNHCGQHLFTYDSTIKTEKGLSDLRKEFWHGYAKSLGFDVESDASLLEHFRCDGNSLIINPYVNPHKDSNNDTFDAWDNTLSVNGHFPITDEMWDCSTFWQILRKLGYSKHLHTNVSVSLMIYSRKCVGDFCRSVIETNHTCKLLRERGNQMIDVVMKGLNDVGSPANYRNLFDDVDALKVLSTMSRKLEDTIRISQRSSRGGIKKHKSYPPQFKGVLAETVAAYDKLVSHPFCISAFLVISKQVF